MVTVIPTVVIAGVRSGVGKTTIATGIMGALHRRGYKVRPFKTGPDYIDPSYHQLACNCPSRNLDTWLLEPSVVLELFQRANLGGDIAVVEGVMGLFDGHSGLTEEGSTAEVAKLLRAPVVLVVDVSKVARSVAAEVLGFQRFDRDVNIAGVILNGVAGPRHLDFCAPAIQAATGLPVFGYLPRTEDLKIPERHLGLIPTVEGIVADEWCDRVVRQVEATIHLDRIAAIAQSARTPQVAQTVFPTSERPFPKRAAIALAMDKAFSFYYQDSLDLLEAWGAEVIPFSPMENESLPKEISCILIGGGFPEIFARQLAENEPMKRALREAARAGVTIYGECGGLMYLGRSIIDFEGREHPMVSLLPVSSRMRNSRLSLGYRTVRALADGPLLRHGETVRGHEFHWSTPDAEPATDAAYEVLDQPGRREGFRSGSVWASYVHLHLGSAPQLAPRLVGASQSFRETRIHL